MTKRKEWTLFYCTKEIDEVLRECDNKRAEAIQREYEERIASKKIK